MTLLECVEEYKNFLQLDLKGITAQRYLSEVVAFCIYMHDKDSREVTDLDFIDYLKLLQKAHYSHNGLVAKCSYFRSFVRYGNLKGWFTFSPELIPNMKKEWKRPQVASQEQYEKILSVIPNDKFTHIRNRALIMMLWDTGARNGEIVSMNEKDLDLENMKAVVKTEKSRGRRPFREVYWTTETNQALMIWLEKKHSIEAKLYIKEPEALFWGSTNNWQGKRLTNHAVDLVLRKYSNLAKVPCLRPHSMRHHMGHDLSEKGANNSQISSILGHSQLSSSYIYTELNDREREKAYNKFKRGQ